MMNVVRRRTKPYYRRCAFTGYRPQKMVFGFNESDPRCIEFKARLRQAIEDLIGQGYVHFISGGAMGMDMFAAEAVVDLKEKYPWIILEMVSPFDGQAAKWSPEYRERHDRLFEEADMVTVISHHRRGGKGNEMRKAHSETQGRGTGLLHRGRQGNQAGQEH